MSSLKKILVVDDQEEIVEILQIYIDGAFEEVETIPAFSGNEAVELLEEESIHSIICDYRMPDGDGSVVYNYNQQNTHLPFVWHSATIVDDIANVEGVENKDYKIITKPVDEDELISVVKEMTSETDVAVNEYRKIRIEYIKKAQVTCPLFLKVGQKFIQINTGDDPLEASRIESYETKGESYLYLLAADFLQVSNTIVNQIRDKFSKSTCLEDVYFATNDMLKNFYSDLDEMGISSDQIELVNSFTESCLRELNKNNEIREILNGIINKNNYISSHALVLIHIANFIGELDEDDSSKIAKAAILHDLGLKNDRLAKVHVFDEAHLKNLTPQENDLVKNHAKSIITKISNQDGIDEEILRLIRIHHEPQNCANELEKVFYFSHDVAHYICAGSFEDMLNHLRASQEYYESIHFNDLYQRAKTKFNI